MDGKPDHFIDALELKYLLVGFEPIHCDGHALKTGNQSQKCSNISDLLLSGAGFIMETNTTLKVCLGQTDLIEGKPPTDQLVIADWMGL